MKGTAFAILAMFTCSSVQPVRQTALYLQLVVYKTFYFGATQEKSDLGDISSE